MFKLVTIKKRADFLLFRRQENSLTSSLFIVKQYPNQESHSQFGLIVSKKVSKLAVDRNLVKRRMKSAIRDLKPIFFHPTNILLIAKSRVLGAKYQELKDDLDKIFKKINAQQANYTNN